MKKLIILFSLFSVLCSTNALAANYKISPYAAIDLGMNTSSDTSVYGIVVGGKLHTNYGLELSYNSYGDGLRLSGFALDVLGYLPTRHIIAVAGVGYGIYNHKDAVATSNDASSDNGIRVSGGINYRFTRDITGRAMLRYVLLKHYQNPIDLTFGVSYSF